MLLQESYTRIVKLYQADWEKRVFWSGALYLLRKDFLRIELEIYKYQSVYVRFCVNMISLSVVVGKLIQYNSQKEIEQWINQP